MKKTAITATVILAGVTLIAVNRWQTYINDLSNRFPNLDRKVIRKAYKQFLKNAADDKYGPMSDFSDEKMDALFMEIVREQTGYDE